MSRTLGLLLALIAFTNAYYLGNYYVGALPYRFLDAQYDDRLGLGQLHSARDASVDGSALQKDKKDTIPIKRFKPCYYSPIQCLIKRR
ncbi:hypothetical protein Q1695_005369 [Nippostrongylus brasiliensis]|nr:hypothetical protein Q1695_005369 [Nippostrongylus brasiliensis]